LTTGSVFSADVWHVENKLNQIEKFARREIEPMKPNLRFILGALLLVCLLTPSPALTDGAFADSPLDVNFDTPLDAGFEKILDADFDTTLEPGCGMVG